MASLLSIARRLQRRSASGGGPEGGMALVMSLSVAFIVFALGAVWIGIGTHQVTITGRDKLREQARNVAEAGLNAAMSRLSGNSSFTGLGLTAMTGGEFEVSVLPVSVDPNDTRRYIVAKGFAPTKAHPKRVARRLEQQVTLVATGGFHYALFTYPGGISTANYMTVNGDVYATGDLPLSNNAIVAGSVTALGSISTTNGTSIAGDVTAGRNVTLDNSGTTVLGNVYAGGNVTMTAHVRGNVQAGGSISGGTIDGSRAQYSPPPPLPVETLPTFTWDPANYPSVSTWASPAAFQTYWSAHRDGFSGAHRILCPAPCSTAVDLNARWTITGDTTIVADGPVNLSRDMANAAGRPVTLGIVTYAANQGATPAASMSNNVTLPDDVDVVFYVPNGTVKFSNLKHFTGMVYAASIVLDQQFTLTAKPVVLPGFDFGLTSSRHFGIQAGAFKEVSFS
jgi:hypothetical protein